MHIGVMVMRIVQWVMMSRIVLPNVPVTLHVFKMSDYVMVILIVSIDMIRGKRFAMKLG